MSRRPESQPRTLRGRPVRPSTLAVLSVLGALAGACVSEQPPSPFGSDPVPEPVLFAPGVVATESREYGIAFSPDGREAYFTRRPRRERPRILVTRYEAGAWSEPEPLPFSLDSGEEPFLDRSGRRLFFSARSPFVSWLEDGAESIWMSTRTAGGGWSEPVPLPGTVNQLARPLVWTGDDDEEWDPSDVERSGPVLLDERTLLYSAAVDPEWRSDLYVAYEVEGRFIDATPLSPRVNTQGDEENPALSPDGRLLVFQGYRADGTGEEDLYVAERFENGFTAPRLLPPPINSEDGDGYPAFSPDGRYFFFSSDRGDDWSIYYVDADVLRSPAEKRIES